MQTIKNNNNTYHTVSSLKVHTVSLTHVMK